METENKIHVVAPRGIANESNGDDTSISKSVADSLPVSSFVKVEQNGDVTEFEKDVVDSESVFQEQIDTSRAVAAEVSSRVQAEEGLVAAQGKDHISIQEMQKIPLLGVKRARMEDDEQNHPSVHVMYSSLTGDSKQKLGELLQQWSEWHAQHISTSQDPNVDLLSGEETYFPALRTGLEEASAVSFWMDGQSGKETNKQLVSLDGNSAPLYDRGYALGLIAGDTAENPQRYLEIIEDASRCFNCGSYNHSLKECPKPRDNVAVNNARKQLKSKRNQTAGSRNSVRYYQDSPGGKFDGLRPGALDAETRKLLGLGELDPPPWLNRMREMGYPPGYLGKDVENEDDPSGITIYIDGDVKKEEDGKILETVCHGPNGDVELVVEDGEMLETQPPEPKRKMSVQFPGINAPIPENADEKRWAAASSIIDLPRNRSHHRQYHYSETSSKGHHPEHRGSRDFRDDEPICPPGVEPDGSLAMPATGISYSSYSSYSYRGTFPLPRSPAHGWSSTDRGRRSPLILEDSPSVGSYSSLRNSSSSSRFSTRTHGSTFYEHRSHESRRGGRDEPSYDRDDWHRRHCRW